MAAGLFRWASTALASALLVCGQGPRWRQLGTMGDVTPTHGSAIGFHPPTRRIVQFGGITPGQDEAQYRLLIAEWSLDSSEPLFWRSLEAKGDLPGGRSGSAYAYDPSADRLVIVGGAEDRPMRRLRNDVYVLDHAAGVTGEPTWSRLEPLGDAPEPLAHGQAVLLRGGSHLLVFGGCSEGPHGCDIERNDVWVLSGIRDSAEESRWRRLDAEGATPSPRVGHSLTACPGPDDLVVFGGYGARVWNDAWRLDLDARAGDGQWENLAILGKPPAGRHGHAAACLASEDALLVVGGTRVSHVARDVWILAPLGDSAQRRWRQLSIEEPYPAAREHADLLVDGSSGRVLLRGGVGMERYFSDSWVLELGSSVDWEFLP